MKFYSIYCFLFFYGKGSGTFLVVVVVVVCVCFPMTVLKGHQTSLGPYAHHRNATTYFCLLRSTRTRYYVTMATVQMLLIVNPEKALELGGEV